MSDDAHTRELLATLGPEVVQIGVAARFAASLDNSRLSFMPDAVVRPRDEEDIATLLRLANTHRVPVVPRGAGTATTGSASPLRGGWVLDMSGWKNLHIDAEAGVAYAQPGVVTAELASVAAKAGWFYPPDPSSDNYCTIGGNIACNAGGMRGAKYGVTRDYVMALEGFLPTGEWVRWGADLRKFAAGPNLRDLWIGSEGLLGVITGAVLRLVPAPETRATFLCAFEDEERALEVSRRIMASRLNPSIVEFMDRASVGCTIEEGLVLPFDAPLPSVPAVLLVEVDGDAAQVARAAAALRELASPNMAFVQASDNAQVQALWAVRRRCSKAMFRLADGKLNEDVVVPPRSQEDLLKLMRGIGERHRLHTPIFGHAGDGNFHVHVMFHRGEPDECQRAEAAVGELMHGVVAMGGAISGEHGIGLAKSPFLGIQHGQAEIAAMKAVKNALDPNGIMNPGKVFEPFRVWEHPIAKVKLPWD